jgi:hypothetical protein
MDDAKQNTDKEIWRKVPGDYYSPSIHVTEGGGIGFNVGGYVIVQPIEAWHAQDKEIAGLREELEAAYNSGSQLADDLYKLDRGIVEIFCPNFANDGLLPESARKGTLYMVQLAIAAKDAHLVEERRERRKAEFELLHDSYFQDKNAHCFECADQGKRHPGHGYDDAQWDDLARRELKEEGKIA